MQESHIQKLMEFSELHKNFMQNRRPSESGKQLFETSEEFKREHPEVRLNARSNVIDKRTFAAQGTNAWTLFSAFAFTNGQLLPKNEMKVRGIPVVAGELIYEKTKNKAYEYALCPNTVSQNAVSTVGLHNRSSYLLDAFRYAEMATKCYNCDYGDFSKKYLNKYQKRSVDNSIVEKATVLLNDKDIREAYERLSTISVVALGNRIGETIIGSSIDNEHGCERFNIRVVVVDEKSREYIRSLVSSINPAMAESVMYLTNEEIDSFEKTRNYNKNYGYVQSGSRTAHCMYENSFVSDFEEAFKDKLTFSFSDQFSMCKIEKKKLVKETIKGKPKVSTATITYYQSPDPTSETTVDDVDYSVVFTESFQSKVGSNVAINCDNEQILEQPAAITQQLTSTSTQQKQPADGVASSQKTFTSDRNNNDLHGKLDTQPLFVVDNKIHNSSQKQQPSGTSPGGWTMGLALLFGAVGTTLAAMGTIPEIAAIGVIATAVLLGIASAALGGAVGYLTDITVNKCCSEAATKVA